MEKKFSEGLWKITLAESHQVQISPFVNGVQQIAIAYAWRPELREEVGPLLTQDEMIANAKLICAAPDMIGALDAARQALIMTSMIDKSSVSKQALYQVEAAIKKALE